MSWERDRARRIAQFYGPDIARLPRAERFEFVRLRVAAIEAAELQRCTRRDEDHKRVCLDCQSGGFCLR